jgi:hypothetical protein
MKHFIGKSHLLLGLVMLLLNFITGCQPNAYLQSRDDIGRIGGHQGDFPAQVLQIKQLNGETKYICQMFQITIESRRHERNFLLAFGLFIAAYCIFITIYSLRNRQKFPVKPIAAVVFIIVNIATLAYGVQVWLPQDKIIGSAQLEYDQLCPQR